MKPRISAPPAEDAAAPPAPSPLADAPAMAAALRALGHPSRLALLGFLRRPRYAEEIASHLRISREGARKHLQRLLDAGLVERRGGLREGTSVIEYVVNGEGLFLLYDAFERWGSQHPGGPRSQAMPTVPVPTPPGRRAAIDPCLTVVHGFNVGLRVHLDPRSDAPAVIGRERRCDLALRHDAFASGRHAEVAWTGRGFRVRDLRSTNGTSLNWQPLPKGGQRDLRHGDIVGVGKTLLLFWEAPPGGASVPPDNPQP